MPQLPHRDPPHRDPQHGDSQHGDSQHGDSQQRDSPPGDAQPQAPRRSRSRPQRRAIHCPEHGVYLDSVSQKYPLFTTEAEHLRQRGLSRQRSLTVIAGYGAVPLDGEWIEAFWCDRCQATRWFHIRKTDPRCYSLRPAPEALWLQASGVIQPGGNPSVGEFTRRQARQTTYGGPRDFRRLG